MKLNSPSYWFSIGFAVLWPLIVALLVWVSDIFFYMVYAPQGGAIVFVIILILVSPAWINGFAAIRKVRRQNRNRYSAIFFLVWFTLCQLGAVVFFSLLCLECEKENKEQSEREEQRERSKAVHGAYEEIIKAAWNGDVQQLRDIVSSPLVVDYYQGKLMETIMESCEHHPSDEELFDHPFLNPQGIPEGALINVCMDKDSLCWLRPYPRRLDPQVLEFARNFDVKRTALQFPPNVSMCGPSTVEWFLKQGVRPLMETLPSDIGIEQSYFGDYRFQDPIQKDELAKLKYISGTLWIKKTAGPIIDLPSLMVVGGSVIVQENIRVHHVSLKHLRTIGESLTVIHNLQLETLEMPELYEVGEKIQIESNINLRQIYLPMFEVSSKVEVIDNYSLEDLALPIEDPQLVMDAQRSCLAIVPESNL